MSRLSQMCPPNPGFTAQNLPDLSGRVYIVTGSNTGVGKELAQILFCRNAKVYIAARSETKARAAIESIRVACPASSGTLVFHHLVLDDLSAVAESAHEFLAKEGRLDVLFNNAGVMHPPQGSVTVQGYELQLGVHNLAPVLFTEMLTPLLEKTANALAQEGKKDLVRVVWVSSLYAEMGSPKGGFDPDNIDYGKKDQSKYFKYSASKAGVYYQGVEYGRRHAGKGIVSVSLNPGNLKSDLQRHAGSLKRQVADLMLFAPINGAYTELFAGLSPDVTMEKSGSYIIPWGRFGNIRSDLLAGSLPKSEGGTAMAGIWYSWCMQQVQKFMDNQK
ncbi:NAD(P)-binding protein [Pleurostoma richardsiae]|uniref:NAD(P)-binding protein n=1 Tax=Pleurostoma richardsiae TaxID=41990 RepID=A0AA38R7I7_9PEZI|nr:NAD(P)-binding protein [Pleurostoma richardsiae]